MSAEPGQSHLVPGADSHYFSHFPFQLSQDSAARDYPLLEARP